MRILPLFTVACVLNCGSTQTSDDASTDALADTTSNDASDATDANDGNSDGPSFVFVDGGTECGIPAQTQCTGLIYYSCCNGALCRGDCVLFANTTTPECVCAGFTGGCPGSQVCCSTAGCVGDPQKCPPKVPPPPGVCDGG